MTIQDLCQDALLEIGVLAQGESISAGDAAFTLGKLRRLFNSWNANRRAVYATSFVTNTLVPALSPHTIGPSAATWTVTQRPVSVEGATLVLTTSSPVANLPITIRDAVWWDAQTVPDITSSVPTDLYYQPDWPNGKLFFWPVPDTAYDVQLMLRLVLVDTVALGNTFTLPPGYHEAVTLTLAASLCRSYGVPTQMAGEVAQEARLARAQVFGNNEQPVRIQTADAGLSGQPGTRPTYNYLTGPYG